jgi:Uma2 family endonuclease
VRPGPGDIRLAVEISHSSLRIDLKAKAGLYARAGIREYWVLDVENRLLFVHRDPQAGRYRSPETYSGDEGVSPLAAPDAVFRVSEIFRDPS